MCWHTPLLMRQLCVPCAVSESALGNPKLSFLGTQDWEEATVGHVQSSALTPLMLCICQCVVELSVATCCPLNRANSSSEKAPWRKWALWGTVGGH